MSTELNAAAFNGQKVDTKTAQSQISSANNLIQTTHNLPTTS
jgi:hypothetical protein